jgi:hypothetical protein
MSSIASSSSSRAAWITGLFVLTLGAGGCAPPQTCPAVTTAAAPRPSAHDRSVYRFDFGLTASDGTGAAPTTSSFTLTMQEGDKGEVHVGKNVSLSPPSTATSGAAAPGVGSNGARQDVGLKVAAQFRAVGDEPLLDVSLEMSTFDPPSTIRKVVAKSDALAFAGKPVLVTSLEEDHKRYQLTVTATKVR